MSRRALKAFILCVCVLIGVFTTTSSATKPSRYLYGSSRATKHHHRADSVRLHSHRSHSSRAAHRAAAAQAIFGTVHTAQTGVNPHRKRHSISNAPPEKCGHGSISYIKCWLDANGFVSGVSFESRLGTKGHSLCNTEGKHQEETFLYEGETILDIVACRAPEGGITRLEFHTDSSRVDQLTCGHGKKKAKSEKAELEDDSSSSSDSSGDSTSSSSSSDSSSSSSDTDEAASEVCESLTQGYAPQGAYEISSNGPKQSDSVHYELKEMYPIGGLTARCSKHGGPIQDITNTCWESESSQPSVQGPVVVEAWVQLNDGPAGQVKDPVHQEECLAELCADAHITKQLSTWASTAVPHILEEGGTRDVWVKHSVLGCKPCGDTSGTMLQVALALYTQQGSLPAVEQALKALMAQSEKNLCRAKDVAIGCTQTGVGMLKLANVWVKSSSKTPRQLLR